MPAWVPVPEQKPAPAPLLLVQAFVNTRDLDRGTDLLADPGPADRWLHESGLLAPQRQAGPGDLRAARDVREGIRALLASNSGGPPPAAPDLQPLEALAGQSPLRLAIGPEGGWTEDELDLFRKEDWTPVTLGPTILRAETAAIASVAITTSLLS